MNFWHLYEHIQSLSTAVAGFKSTMYGYVFMTCISNVNGEIVLNFYFRHQLWAGLWCTIPLSRASPSSSGQEHVIITTDSMSLWTGWHRGHA